MSDRPLHILQVNTVFHGGGTDNQSLELAAGLQGLRQPVWLAAPPGRACATAAHLAHVPMLDLESTAKSRLISTLTRLIREKDIHIIHAHHGRDYWPALLAARNSNRPVRVVLTRHLATLPSLASRILLLSCCDALVAVSEEVRRVLQNGMRGNPRKIHLAYGGVDAEGFAAVHKSDVRTFREQHGWEPHHMVCAVVGSYTLPRGKGQLEFLEAAARLKDVFPQARFAIVGQGSMKSLLEVRIHKLGLEDRVTLVPFTDAIPVVMNAIDILVHPAVGTEALGLVLWEAMACGKPVIASRLGGIPEAFLDRVHGHLVPSGNISALTEALHGLLLDPVRRQRFGEAGRLHVLKHYTRPLMAQRALHLYQQLTHADAGGKQ